MRAKIDKKGRILIPKEMRESLKLDIGREVIISLEDNEIKITPFPTRGVKMKLTFGDKPGSLARAANLLSQAGVDLLYTESKTTKRGERAEWLVFADVSKAKDLKAIKKEILSKGVAEKFEILGECLH